MTDQTVTDHLDPVRRDLLAAALTHVPFDGWSEVSLRKAAEDCGVDIGQAHLAFPRITDLVCAFIQMADQAMLANLETQDLPSMRVRERIAAAVQARIEAVMQYREAERRAVAFMALPGNAVEGLKSLQNTVDLMWRAAGDTSTDFNFYTKRFILAGVYTSTLLYWLSDVSEDYAETWSFLDRRIDDVMKIEKCKAEFREKSEGAPSPLRTLSRMRYDNRYRMKP